MERISGTYLGQGAACPLFRLDDGELITLTGRLPGMLPGSTYDFEGRWRVNAGCMQGRTFDVQAWVKRAA